MSSDESKKGDDAIAPIQSRDCGSIDGVKNEARDDEFEVFKKGEGQVDFRTVSWIHASVIFLKGKVMPRPSPNGVLLINISYLRHGSFDNSILDVCIGSISGGD
jgi:hypothetical protein